MNCPLGDKNADRQTDSATLTLAEGHRSCHLACLNYLDVWVPLAVSPGGTRRKIFEYLEIIHLIHGCYTIPKRQHDSYLRRSSKVIIHDLILRYPFSQSLFDVQFFPVYNWNRSYLHTC